MSDGLFTGARGPVRRRVAGALLWGSLGALIVLVVYIMVQTYGLASAIREQQKVTVDTNHIVASCVTPGGKCYRQSQERAGAAVVSVGQLSIYAAACADTPGVQGAPEIQRCVRKLVQAAEDANAETGG